MNFGIAGNGKTLKKGMVISMKEDNKSVYGLVGRTLGHSYSPQIHCEFGAPDYRLFQLEPNEVASFLRRGDIGGLNVTIPYKRDVMLLCDCVSPEAREIGCVNTVVRCDDGILCGYNTDTYGLEYMIKRAGISFAGGKAIILGSGGSSLTAQYVAKKLGVFSVVVVSRNGENNYDNLDRHTDADIIVNTTPVGMYPETGKSPVDLELFPKCRGVIDLIFNPRRTALLMQAEFLKIPYSGGLPMLVAQAKEAEQLFFGGKIDECEIERVIKKLYLDRENIVLVGMPGCGKNTVGKALATLTGRHIIDIDCEIEKSDGRTIPEIFREDGEEYFRSLELDKTAVAGRENGIIILTGGGVVKNIHSYPSLHQNGRIYHIERDITKLDKKDRPLSQKTDLYEMYRERLPMYERFRDAVIYNNSTPEVAAEAIWKDFLENSGE